MSTEISRLLLNSLRIFREIADFLGNAETSHDLGKFFGHVNAYSLLLTECLPPVQHAVSMAELDLESLFHLILTKFSSFLRCPVLPEYESALPLSNQFPELTTLVHYWGLSEPRDDQILHVIKCLDFSSPTRRAELILLLRGCVATLQSQHPEDPTVEEEHRTSRKKRKRPSSVWVGASTVFQALAAASKACSPIHRHEYAARLRLATHRKQVEDMYEFEAFVTLSLTCCFWQETRIHAIVSDVLPPKKAGVTFVVPKSSHTNGRNRRCRRLAVDRLCEQIEKLKSKPSMRLNLAVEDGRLWKDQSSRSEHPISLSHSAHTLEDIIRYRPTSLTEKVKRVLAVLLAYSVLHLQGTPWLPPSSFKAANILFFGTSTAIPLKPYIHTELGETVHCQVQAEEIDAGIDPDDLPSHPHPDIVMLATMLMELYMIQPIQSLAEQVGMTLDDWDNTDENTRYLTAIAVFDRFKADFPDNYRDAVDRCLDPNIGFDDNDEELDTEGLKSLIYEEIVQPLEDELDQGFGNTVQIDSLDEIAQTIDLTSWGQMRLNQQPQKPVQDIRPVNNPPNALNLFASHTYISSTTLHQTLNERGRKHQDYTVGWICALPKELAAAQALFDEIHSPLPQDPGDQNTYTLGRMGQHNVVMACLPSKVIGTVSAARVANHMLSTFKWLRFGVMVGIGGGVPGAKDIRLGDVVVGEPDGPFGGVIQYDFGKTVQNCEFRRTGSLNRPPDVLLTAISRLKADHYRGRPKLDTYLKEMIKKHPQLHAEFSHPGVEHDVLYESDYDHPPRNEEMSCERCDPARLVQRTPRESHLPVVHYGLIASGNQVMRDGNTRDRLRKDLDVICFEMEAAGIVDVFPCLVIRGICDYSDSHKNKLWQGYAAATAAAYTKELLSVIPTRHID